MTICGITKHECSEYSPCCGNRLDEIRAKYPAERPETLNYAKMREELLSVVAERDALQARAEVLERAIFEARDCSFCVHQNIDRLEDVYCDVCLFAEEERPRWQFDQARLSGESTPRQNEMED